MMSNMEKYEYTIVYIKNGCKDAHACVTELNQFGQEGWRTVESHRIIDSPNDCAYLMERPLVE